MKLDIKILIGIVSLAFLFGSAEYQIEHIQKDIFRMDKDLNQITQKLNENIKNIGILYDRESRENNCE